MTKAHTYKASSPGYYYIDSKRVSQDRFEDSISRSQRIQEQPRDRGRFAVVVGPAPRAGEVVPVRREAPPPSRKWMIRGTGRPRSDTNARTDKLVTDHFVEVDERVGNIDEQEQLLNEKYDDYVHFDTYIESLEEIEEMEIEE